MCVREGEGALLLPFGFSNVNLSAHFNAVLLLLLLSLFSRVRLFATPWTTAYQAPLSMGFSRQEYWNGVPCPPPGDLPDPGIDSESPALGGGFLTTVPSEKPIYHHTFDQTHRMYNKS